MTTALILFFFAALPWWLPALIAGLRRVGVVVEWGEVVEGEARRWKREREAEPQPGRITGGHDTGVRFPRHMREQEATDEQFVEWLNGDTAAEEIAPEIAGDAPEGIDLDDLKRIREVKDKYAAKMAAYRRAGVELPLDITNEKNWKNGTIKRLP